jgi:16S rRNA (uracil1498-N3)-methyltransferase
VAAAKQCGRSVVPVIHPVAAFADVLASAPAARPPVSLFMCLPPEPHARDVRAHPVMPAGDALALIGPEGGWSDVEIEAARMAGAQQVRLGPRTLRAESVPAVVLTTFWTWWGWSS